MTRWPFSSLKAVVAYWSSLKGLKPLIRRRPLLSSAVAAVAATVYSTGLRTAWMSVSVGTMRPLGPSQSSPTMIVQPSRDTTTTISVSLADAADGWPSAMELSDRESELEVPCERESVPLSL